MLDASGFVRRRNKLQHFHGARLADCHAVTDALRRQRRHASRRIGNAPLQSSISVVERDLTLADLEQADEIFVTNALFGIWPVARLDERDIGLGAQTAALAQLLGYGHDA